MSHLNQLIHELQRHRAGLKEEPFQARAKAGQSNFEEFESALSQIDYMTICTHSLKQIFHSACRICVENGGFSLAWIGLADPATQRITPREVAGQAAPFLDEIDFTSALDIQAGREPSCIAYNEQRIMICNDISTGLATEAWRHSALASGLRSSIALPLFSGGKSCGTLTAYAAEIDFIDTELAKLLEKMADRLTHAIEKFHHEERHRLDNERLLNTEERFRALVDNLPLKIFIKDVDSLYISCNELFAKDIGVSSGQIAGKSDYDFFPRELAEKYRNNDKAIIGSGESFDLHERQVKGTVESFAHVIKAPFRDSAGRIVGVFGASWDITERKQAERIRDHFAYEVEDLYQNAPCGYHSTDADGTITRINNTELNWLGYTREEVVDRINTRDLLTAESRRKFFEQLPILMRTGVLQDYEIEMVRKNGTILPVILSATAVYDEEGCYVSSRTMVCDISMYKELEQEKSSQGIRLEDLSHRLVAVQEEERRRLAGELHDRASPNLAAIQLTLENMAASLSEEVVERNSPYLDDLYALLADTSASIRDICTELRPPLLDYAGLLPTLQSYAHQFMQRTGIVVSVDSQLHDPQLGKEVESIIFRIAQEAIANCAKHSFAKNIQIQLVNDWRHTALTIKDDGIGFNPEGLGHSGTIPGLGLITMRERAEFANGNFSLTSNPGAGTEIRVEFRHQDKRNSLSRRRHDYFASAIDSTPASAPTQSRKDSVEKRAGMSRRRKDLAANAIGASLPTDPIHSRGDFIERRACMSRRKQDFSSGELIHPGISISFPGNFIERRGRQARRQQDLAENNDARAVLLRRD